MAVELGGPEYVATHLVGFNRITVHQEAARGVAADDSDERRGFPVSRMTAVERHRASEINQDFLAARASLNGPLGFSGDVNDCHLHFFS